MGTFPRAALRALGDAGLLGLVSSIDVGGLGGDRRDAALVVERIGRVCGSTAMVLCMRYVATAVIEAHGPLALRAAIAAGRHLTTLAFSEVGSRAQYWAPMSTATADAQGVVLDADKSWVTSAGEADSYVWSSRPVAVEGASTLWLVDAHASGLEVVGRFDGLGLRGNASCPVRARGVRVSGGARLGEDGGGFAIMMGVVLPWFQALNAGMSVGLMAAAVDDAARHVSQARLEHLGQSLAEQPVVRADIARMRVAADMARAYWMDCLDAPTDDPQATLLRVLAVKTAASDAAADVTDRAMRVSGGAAFRREVGVERRFRDARAAMVVGPTSDALRDFIGRAACGMPLFA